MAQLGSLRDDGSVPAEYVPVKSRVGILPDCERCTPVHIGDSLSDKWVISYFDTKRQGQPHLYPGSAAARKV